MKSDDTGAFSEETPEATADLEEAPVLPEQTEKPTDMAEGPLVEVEELAEHVKVTEEPGEASNDADESAEPLAGNDREVSDEVEEMFRLVPEIGTAFRWYDPPYWLLEKLFIKRRYWGKLPRPVRRSIIGALNWFLQFNHFDREKIAHLNNPLYNIVVPDGEEVSLPHFWVVEYYSPSPAVEAERRIGARKWSQNDYIGFGSAENAFRQARQRDRSVGIYPIATLVPKDYQGFHPYAVRENFPAAFGSISLTLMPLGSALTAIVARFDLTDTAAASLDDALRAKHQPELHRDNGRLQVRERMFAGLKHVQTVREELHQAARNWFAQELPGLFAVEAKASHPTLDLLLTQRFDPFRNRDEGERDYSNYERALGLDEEPFTLVHSPEWKRIRIMEYAFETNDGNSRDAGLALVTRFDEALGRKKKNWRGGEGRSKRGIVTTLDYGAPGLLTRFGLFQLLRIKQEAVAGTRDKASSLHSRRPVTSAKKLRESVLRSSLDMATVAPDIEALAANAGDYEWEVPSLATRRLRENGKWGKSKKDLLKKWAKDQAEDARRLADLDKDLLSILGLASNLNATVEGIRSQRWSIVIGILALISSGAAVWFAYLALSAPAAMCGG